MFPFTRVPCWVPIFDPQAYYSRLYPLVKGTLRVQESVRLVSGRYIS